MNGVSGYLPWRWIFILEGAFTVLPSLIAFCVLPDLQEQAKFLTIDERAVLLRKLARDTKDYVETKSTWQVVKDYLTDPKPLFR